MSLRQWLLLCLPAFCWGSAFVFMEVALPVFPPLVILVGRMCVAALMLNGIRFLQGQVGATVGGLGGGSETFSETFLLRQAPLSLWVQCAGLGVVNTLLPFGLVVWAQQYISASLAAILISVAPIFTVLLAVVVLGERLTLARGVGSLLGFSGVVVLVGPSVLRGMSLQGVGELAILAAALTYAVAGFWGGRFKGIPSQALSTMTISMGAVIILAIGMVVSLRRGEVVLLGEVSLPAVLAILGLGVFSTAIAYIIYFRLLAEVGVVNTSLVSFLVPVFTLLLSTLLLGERLSGGAMVGMGLILLGLAVLDGRLLSVVGKAIGK